MGFKLKQFSEKIRTLFIILKSNDKQNTIYSLFNVCADPFQPFLKMLWWSETMGNACSARGNKREVRKRAAVTSFYDVWDIPNLGLKQQKGLFQVRTFLIWVFLCTFLRFWGIKGWNCGIFVAYCSCKEQHDEITPYRQVCAACRSAWNPRVQASQKLLLSTKPDAGRSFPPVPAVFMFAFVSQTWSEGAATAWTFLMTV